jgi:acyl-CoA thioesterase II
VDPRTPVDAALAPGAVRHRPCGYPARAWWRDQLVAESSRAVRVEEPGREPLLCFPLADVALDRFVADERPIACPLKGAARRWRVAHPDDGAAPTTGPAPTDSWMPAPSGADDGADALWAFPHPPPELAWLADLATFDHDTIRVEVVDAVAGDDPLDVTVKRFPTWGDAAQLVAVLDVVPAAPLRYVSVAHDDGRRPVVEGSQMLGQAIVAAMRHAPGRRVVSAHAVFVRVADARLPLELRLHEVTGGRTFTTVAVDVTQRDRTVATATVLLDVTAPDVVRHHAPAPDVVGPYASAPHDMGVTGRDLRVVDGAYTSDPDAPVGPPVLDAWVRFRSVPDDPALHAGLLAQFTGHLSIGAALRPHAGVGEHQAHRTLSTAVNAIALSVHADVRTDRWLLYHHESTYAGDGMTHSACRVHTEGGALVASFSVDAMVRGFAGGGPAGRDERSAM